MLHMIVFNLPALLISLRSAMIYSYTYITDGSRICLFVFF